MDFVLKGCSYRYSWSLDRRTMTLHAGEGFHWKYSNVGFRCNRMSP